MQEVDYRERNLRFAEMSIFALLAEHLIMLTTDLLPTASDNRVKIKRGLHEEIAKMLGKYEAEIYQDRYLPEYQRSMREISRREKDKAEEMRRRDQAALDKVAAFGNSTET